jgi:hypothetical protein
MDFAILSIDFGRQFTDQIIKRYQRSRNRFFISRLNFFVLYYQLLGAYYLEANDAELAWLEKNYGDTMHHELLGYRDETLSAWSQLKSIAKTHHKILKNEAIKTYFMYSYNYRKKQISELMRNKYNF